MRALVVAAAAATLVAGAARAAPGPVVVIDPGHDAQANLATEPIGPGSTTRKIEDGGGTHGVVTGIREPDLTLDVSLRLRHAPARRRCPRRDDPHAHRRQEHGQHRAGRGSRTGPERRSSCASTPTARPAAAARGTHTLTPAYRRGWTDDVYRPSRRAASLVQADVVRALGFPDRGIQEHLDFTGFNWADVPVILVELGFMTNPAEDRALATDAVRHRAAVGLCRGTLRFLGRPPARCGV